MQKLISAEQKSKEQLESQITELRNIKPGKGYNRILEAEIEVLKNKLKHAEAIANETSSLLKSLQQEMAQMKKKHKIAMHEVLIACTVYNCSHSKSNKNPEYMYSRNRKE